MGQAKMGELRRAARQLGVTGSTLCQHGWEDRLACTCQSCQGQPAGLACGGPRASPREARPAA
jgi:hypothetical protein